MGGNEETTQKNALPSEYRELLFPLLRSDSAAAPLVCFEDKSDQKDYRMFFVDELVTEFV